MSDMPTGAPINAGDAAKLTSWSKEPSLIQLKGDFEAAKPSHDAQLTEIQKWNDLMKIQGQAKPPVVKGRSRIQPKLIRRQAEWRYSALTEPFNSTEKLFSVNPSTAQDVDSANQNEMVLNWQFRTKIDSVKLIDDFVRSVVDDGTSILRLGWIRRTIKTKQEVPVFSHYPIQSTEDAENFRQALANRSEDPDTFNQTSDASTQAALDYYDEQGEPTIAVQTDTTHIDVETVIENRPTVEVLNPANVYIDPSCNGDFEKALFVIVAFETNKADILKDGKRYKNLDQVNWEGNTTITNPDYETSTPNDFNFKDATRKKVVAYEYWGFYDIEGNGTLQPIVATWIGDVLIRMELNPFPDEKLPFVVVNYLPKKRELYGEPDAELLEDNQKILGAVTRGMIDLLGRSANGQTGFAKGMLDSRNRRKFENGEDYEYNLGQNPQQNIITHKYPELPQSALQMVELQNQDAEALTGVKSYSGGLSGDAYGAVASNTRAALDAAGKREMGILRRLAKGMVKVGNKIIAMNGAFLSEQETIPITKTNFVQVSREDLRGNFDLIVDISTAEVDNQKANDLAFVLQTLGPNSDPKIVMNVLAKIAKLKRLPDLAQELTDWQPPPPDPMAVQKAQLELQLMQAQIQLAQSNAQLNMARVGHVVAQQEQIATNTEEQASGITHNRAMEQNQAQSQGNQDLEITKALTKPVKEGESVPNVDAAIGYNQLTKAQS